MKPRPKIVLTFILGTLNKFQEVPDWYLKIDWANNGMVEMLQMEAFSRILWRGCGHIEKLGVLTSIYFRANEQNCIALIKGERNGWFIQRSGGCCASLVKTYETKTVEIEAPRIMDDPRLALIENWPQIPQDAEATLKGAKFSQWPGGTHWYVRLANGIDVEVDGKLKWDTYDEAVAATRRFVAQRKT